jgi:hypothetical protein
MKQKIFNISLEIVEVIMVFATVASVILLQVTTWM